MSEEEIENQVVTLKQHGHRFVSIAGLSADEEDNLYSHLERVYGEKKVNGVVTPQYRVMVEDLSALSLMSVIAQFCTANGKKVET